jgi:AI-2 transport protein TqsA
MMVSLTAIADGRRRVSAGWPLPRAVLVLLGVAGAVVAAAGLRSAAGIVGPAFLALTIVITIHPLLAWLQRHHLPGWLAVTLTMLVTYAALLSLAAALALSVARLARRGPRRRGDGCPGVGW